MSHHKKAMSVLMAVLFLLLWVITGCQKDNSVTQPEDSIVPNTLYPLVAGHIIEYGGHLTAGDSETPIAGTETGYYTKWLVTATIPVSAVFPPAIFPNLANESAVLIKDTTRVPAVGVTGKFTPVFIRQDSTTGDFMYMTNLGYFYRSANTKIWKSASDTTARNDSLRFITLAKPSVGIGTKFTCFDENFISYALGAGSPITIKLKIEGVIEGKETITIDTTAYETYRLVITRTVSSSGYVISQGPTAKLWLANNIGPIQMLLYGNAETPGNFRKMTGKNF